ncbi:hypothetical protein D3C81_580610 [compost metagenome]
MPAEQHPLVNRELHQQRLKKIRQDGEESAARDSKQARTLGLRIGEQNAKRLASLRTSAG